MILDIPHTSVGPYSKQLAKGFRRLAFDGPVEVEFRHYRIATQYRSAKICSAAGFLTWVAMSIFDLVYFAMVNWQPPVANFTLEFFLLRFSVAAIWLTSLILLFTRRKEKSYRRHMTCAYFACGLGSGLCSMLAIRMGFHIDRSVEVIIIMSAFLPIGTFFYQSLAMSLTIALASSFITLALGELHIDPYDWQLAITLMLAVPVAAVGAYLREYSDREQFLYRNIFRAQAFQDALTGIANRRLFEQHASISMTTARRDQINICLAIIDIDFFKQFNDHLGHGNGDIALKAVADQLNQNINRPLDMAARIGGEEFAVLLYDIDQSEAEHILERLRFQIAALNIEHPASPAGRVTVSIGAAFNSNGNLDTLANQADQALYRAKSAGRNRLIIDHHQPPICGAA